ncbi:hypothetical protein R3P38DRAFT_3040217 [Favolaschia claudopus]|uniref:Uncharacterized protein n=1 Tax=Favolaschia claudopus TaxID=2862362 RepID=A0AAW0A9W2_9AGAR
MSKNQSDIQERIAAARWEAETLREKIRAKKESSADTSLRGTASTNETITSRMNTKSSIFVEFDDSGDPGPSHRT